MSATVATTAASGRKQLSTGRRVWLALAIFFSLIILLLVVGGIIGTWVGRSATINAVTALLEGIDQLAGAGREAVDEIDQRVTAIRQPVGQVIAAADQIAANVTDVGLVRTLLPEETDTQLVATANNIRETVSTVLATLEAGLEMYRAVDSIPFVSLPRPDEAKVQQTRDDIEAVQGEVDRLTADIRAFREEAAGQIGRISAGATQIDDRLATAQTTLDELDQRLANTQETARDWQERFPVYLTIAAILATLVQAWVGYGMVNLIRGYWWELRPKVAPAAVLAEPAQTALETAKEKAVDRPAETAIEPAPESALTEAPEMAIEPAADQDVVAAVMVEDAADEEE